MSATIGYELEFVAPSLDGECDVCNGDGEIEDECERCDGSGIVEANCPCCGGRGEESVLCEDCNGEGCDACSGTGEQRISCSHCGGTGTIEESCYYCNGSGYIYTTCDACDGEGYLMQEAQWRINDAVSSYGYGEITTDGSIDCGEEEEGLEFRSRILHVEEDGWTGIEAEVNRVMRILRDYDAYSDGAYTCGLHVHICPDNGWDVEEVEKLAVAWKNWAEEWFIDHFTPTETRMDEYCREIREEMNIREDAETPLRVVRITTRYATMNVRALSSHGTIEFRLFDGTTYVPDIIEAMQAVYALYEECCEDAPSQEGFLAKLNALAVTRRAA